jgi:hypothetical protein
VASYIDRERAAREEQLDWMHMQHEELAAQTDLLRVQTETLQRIARHTFLFFVLTIIGLSIWGLYFLFALLSAAAY